MLQHKKKISIPDEKQLKKISSLLEKKFAAEKREKRLAPVKDVLVLLGKGALLSSVFFAPGITRAMKPLLKKDKHWQDWKKFNPAYLRRTIKRLAKQKMVEIKQEGKKQVVKITKGGKMKILKYTLEELNISQKNRWDGKWRIVIYDIPLKQKRLQDLFRQTLKKLKFWQLQQSVYLTPFACEDKIEFLREYYGLGANVKIIKFKELEDEEVYREFFAI